MGLIVPEASSIPADREHFCSAFSSLPFKVFILPICRLLCGWRRKFRLKHMRKMPQEYAMDVN
jgi:hypothetical protein